MDKPVCRLCGAKHWGREPCSLKGVSTESVNRPVNTPKVNATVNAEVNGLRSEIERLKSRVAELEAENASLTVSAKPKDRKAYMREYMRKRRAK